MTQHTVPELALDGDALEPHISSETLECHHGKHRAACVNMLSELVLGTEFENPPLEQVIRQGSGDLFHPATVSGTPHTVTPESSMENQA